METATWARRILALVVDWFACTLVVIFALGGVEHWAGDSEAGFYVLGVFVLESALFTALMGGSFGQVATRLRVVRENGDPRPIPLHLALARQVLIALVIPPLVYRPTAEACTTWPPAARWSRSRLSSGVLASGKRC